MPSNTLLLFFLFVSKYGHIGTQFANDSNLAGVYKQLHTRQSSVMFI